MENIAYCFCCIIPSLEKVPACPNNIKVVENEDISTFPCTICLNQPPHSLSWRERPSAPLPAWGKGSWLPASFHKPEAVSRKQSQLVIASRAETAGPKVRGTILSSSVTLFSSFGLGFGLLSIHLPLLFSAPRPGGWMTGHTGSLTSLCLLPTVLQAAREEVRVGIASRVKSSS